MKLTRKDIGGELISIITKGMYADPKDALREYVQNGVDADANQIYIRIRHNRIVVIDDGHGINKVVMRRAVRMGVSDKNPKHNVGFMGIGLYSSFHLCDTLSIYSKVKDEAPNKLVFDFKKMRNFLEIQKDIKLSPKRDLQEQIDLQTLLEEGIDFKEISKDEFPTIGTRVEMEGVESNFFMTLSRHEEVSEYLERVVPLPFSPFFKYGELIQKHIDSVCKKHKSEFKTINLALDVNGNEYKLYRPYKDEDFKPEPMSPKFYELNSNEGFLGISWGCLNKGKSIIANEKLRGFVIKKQGFTIGERTNLIPFFKRATFFNRYMGEFIIVHPKLLPNAPRSDFEYSSIRTALYGKIEEVATKYNEYGNQHQEQEKAEEDLLKAIEVYNKILSQLEFFENNGEKLLEFYQELSRKYESFNERVKTGWKIKDAKKAEAEEIIRKMKALLSQIKGLLDVKKSKKSSSKSATAIIKKLVTSTSSKKQIDEPGPENLIELFSFFGFELSDDLKVMIELVDVKFVQSTSKNKADYLQKLADLKTEIEEQFESD
jgi:molecular chaperone HtpG